MHRRTSDRKIASDHSDGAIGERVMLAGSLANEIGSDLQELALKVEYDGLALARSSPSTSRHRRVNPSSLPTWQE